MTEDQLPAAIQEFIQATNRGDSEAFVAAFTPDAYLNDWGREFHGQDGVRSWDLSDNIGVQAHQEFVSAEPGSTPGSYIVTLTVTSGGFNGTGTVNFELLHDRIASARLG